MSDIIKREDAITLVDKPIYPTGNSDYDDGREDEREAIKESLMALPPADRPPKVVAQITFDEEKLREIVKEAVERFKEEYEITDRPQGEWIVYEEGWKDLDYYPPKCKCNQCGYEEDLYILHAKPTNYCPNCGARMKGADDADE